MNTQSLLNESAGFNKQMSEEAKGLVSKWEKTGLLEGIESDFESLADQENLTVEVIDGADHFFRDQMDILENSFAEFIEERLVADKNIASKRRVGKRRRKSRKTKAKAE